MAVSSSFFFKPLLVAFLISSLVLFTKNNAEPQNDIASSICPKATNSTFCRSLLKSAGTTDAMKLANYTQGLAYTRAVETLGHARLLAAERGVNPQLKERYTECIVNLNWSVGGIKEGEESLAHRLYILLCHNFNGAIMQTKTCENSFTQPPPEPSSLPDEARNLIDICEVGFLVANFLAGDDY